MYFSRTFKALNFDFQIQGLSRTFKVRANPVYQRNLETQQSAVIVGFVFEEISWLENHMLIII